jgi:hypothetical protein
MGTSLPRGSPMLHAAVQLRTGYRQLSTVAREGLKVSPVEQNNQCLFPALLRLRVFTLLECRAVMEAVSPSQTWVGPHCTAVFGVAPSAGRGPVSSQLCSLRRIQGQL